METSFTEMDSIFNRTKNALVEFMGILTPIIENAQDDHERLFWHHIYEEEEHRSDRLDILMPKIQAVRKNGADLSNNQPEFVHLLQDISLEKFGLHNFLEHLDLFLFQFKDTELEGKIQGLRNFTYEDYQQMKVILEKLNQEFQGGTEFKTSIPTDEKEGNGSNVKIEAYSQHHSHEPAHSKQSFRKTLTVGSLKQK
ncbi:IMEF encapsulin system ferritin-like cargo protein [Niallia endozanthoxylica]|uniref:IMEF encapsulin system ferritin-like cargo protein n=1 Tax=Niallia endozanthoxylica TaxID=2036016 RepID=UPI001CC6F605|nr:IMEF encapsulin system ferritin-like cargo protein [Niallia endozanthoxylica]